MADSVEGLRILLACSTLLPKEDGTLNAYLWALEQVADPDELLTATTAFEKELKDVQAAYSGSNPEGSDPGQAE